MLDSLGDKNYFSCTSCNETLEGILADQARKESESRGSGVLLLPWKDIKSFNKKT